MIDFLQSAWAFLTSGNVISWVVTIAVVMALFAVIYWWRFFKSLAIFTLSIAGLYFLLTTFDFSWVGDGVKMAKNHVERVIEEGKKK